jgi:hypothetical protein
MGAVPPRGCPDAAPGPGQLGSLAVACQVPGCRSVWGREWEEMGHTDAEMSCASEGGAARPPREGGSPGGLPVAVMPLRRG